MQYVIFILNWCVLIIIPTSRCTIWPKTRPVQNNYREIKPFDANVTALFWEA